MREAAVAYDRSKRVHKSEQDELNSHGPGLLLNWLCLRGRVLRCFGVPSGEAASGAHNKTAGVGAEREDSLGVVERSPAASAHASGDSRTAQDGVLELAATVDYRKNSESSWLKNSEQDEINELRRRRSYSATNFVLPAVEQPHALDVLPAVLRVGSWQASRWPRWIRAGRLALLTMAVQVLVSILTLYMLGWRSIELYTVMSAFSVLSSGISFLVVYRLAQGTFFSGLEGDANQPVPEHELAPVTPPVQRRFRTDDVGTGSRWRNSERASPFVEDGVQTQSAPRERSLRFDDALDAFSERASFDSRSSRRVFSELGVESSQSQERQRSGGHLRRYVNIGSAVFSRDDFNRESLENVPASLDFSSNPNGSTLDREPSAVSDSEMEPPERKPDNRRSGLLPSKLPLRKLFGQRPAHDSKRKGSPHRMSAEGKRHLAPALVHQSALGDELPASEEQRSSREASGLSENLTPVAVQVESLRIVQSWENMRVTDKSEIIAEDFCEGMLSLLSVIDALGPAFRIIKIDIRNHVGGIRRSCTKHGCRTLQRLVDAESNRTSHWLNSTGMGEGTEHILWMKRAMQFVYMLLQMFVEDADLELCVYHSYRKTLRPCHPYIVRKVAENLHRFVPNRTGFVRRIHADEQFVLVQMKRFLKAIEPRLDILVDLYNSNNLERYCRRTCADLRQLALVCLKDQIGDELDD